MGEQLGRRAHGRSGAMGRAAGSIASQARQELSRTCWITFHCRGTTSSVSVTSSPILRNVIPPQHGHADGAG